MDLLAVCWFGQGGVPNQLRQYQLPILKDQSR
jgi:hypothetical protein